MVKKRGAKAAHILLVVLLLLFSINCAYGSTEESDNPSAGVSQENLATRERARTGEVKLNKDYFKGYITDTEGILTSPSQWDKSDWIEASAIVAVTAGLYANDEKIKTWVQRNRNTTTADLGRNARRVGAASVPALGVLYLYGYAAENEKAQKTVLLSVESFAITGVFVQMLKFGTHRHRPYTGDRYNTWDGPGFDSDRGHQSFPSGDASSAFAVATVLATEYHDAVIVPPLAYGVATLIALGRVHDNAHWSSDVFVASAIGYFTGKAVVQAHQSEDRASISFVPFTDGSHSGVMLTARF